MKRRTVGEAVWPAATRLPFVRRSSLLAARRRAQLRRAGPNAELGRRIVDSPRSALNGTATGGSPTLWL